MSTSLEHPNGTWSYTITSKLDIADGYVTRIQCDRRIEVLYDEIRARAEKEQVLLMNVSQTILIAPVLHFEDGTCSGIVVNLVCHVVNKEFVERQNTMQRFNPAQNMRGPVGRS